MNITELSLTELSQKFKEGKLTSREITEAFIKNIEAQNDKLNAMVTTTFDLAREMADAADSRCENDKLLSPLDGMPFTLKDNICTKGIRTTASSRMLEDFVPPYDAEVWQKLKAAGVVLLGKTNLDEFTMGGSTETSAWGYTRNPHDLSRVAGGSSGGSAAAIAANFCAGTIGTDTGGSIRQPAAFCGITGIKVSYGRVSRYGCMSFASSLDSVGILAKTAEDCAIILQVIAGHDEKDSTTPDKEVPNYSANLPKSLNGMRIGIPKEYFKEEGMDSDVLSVMNSTKEILKKMGVELVDISLPHTKYAVPIYYIVAPCEASANLARFDGIRFGPKIDGKTLDEIYTKARSYGFGDEVKRRILIGTYALSAGYYNAFYRKAQKVRTLVKQDFENAFEEVDAILTPADPSVAFKAGDGYSNPLKMYLEDIFVAPASISGICGISTPIGKNKENLPIGAQILCPAFKETLALQIANQIEKEIKD
ncbi:Asp-tRNA(Asn)/Glu-tRNA(Gln) amidotransferase subunit GatA [Candidatus Gracilibacteria bacterium]|nr:Asp-tRNA(Asn)/Glu-tRNA(Gln) amidotransferase subunit GatA [Candidatus Gracilibacteria bacterium]